MEAASRYLLTKMDNCRTIVLVVRFVRGNLKLEIIFEVVEMESWLT